MTFLLRIAQADAYCLPFEYVSEAEYPDLFRAGRAFTEYLQHPTYLAIEPGRYTDDTAMSIGVAELLLERDPEDVPTAEEFADKFVAVHQRDPRQGYSRYLQTAIDAATSGADLITRLGDRASIRNGAAMRAVPLGLLPSKALIAQWADASARCTHNTARAVRSATMVGYAAFDAYHNGRFPAVPRASTLLRRAVSPMVDPQRVGLGMLTYYAATSVAAHTVAAAAQPRMRTLVRYVIDMGGDTDSVAAVAAGLAALHTSFADTPEWMEAQLEPDSDYGPAFLRDLSVQLLQKYPR